MNDGGPRGVGDPAAAVAGVHLSLLAAIAAELGDRATALEARQEEARLADARFFVACLGQFKRGKSTLINALVRRDVLPVGVLPVTAVVTILRYGESPSALVTFADGHTEPIDPSEIGRFVDERQNPDNARGASVVEILLPADILRGGLCLVDTPGISSVHAANTAATRAFVSHVDVALVVVGPDPPLSHDELALIDEVAQEARRVVVVLNKADQVAPAQCAEILAFTKRTIDARLGHPLERLFVVSARERIERQAPTREWQGMEEHLARISAEAGSSLVAAASRRACRRIGQRVLSEIHDHQSALQQPLSTM